MIKYVFMSNNFKEDLYNSPYLDFDENNIFHEWCSIEGSERLNELSRQLRTFINYKQSIIHLRFSKSQIYNSTTNNDLFFKQKKDLISLTTRFVGLLRIIGVVDGVITEKVLNVYDKIKTTPNELEINRLEEIKSLNKEIWKIIHILSELEVHCHPLFLKKILSISCISCEVNIALFSPFSEFYSELKKNYLLLENELSSMLKIKNKELNPTNNNKIGVRITE
jgi:hypothetical protein